MLSNLYGLSWGPFLGLLRKEIYRFIKLRLQTIITPLISSFLYFLIFGLSVGRSITITGYPSYLAFIIPGLVMMVVLKNAFDNSSMSIIAAKYMNELQDLRLVPLSPMQISWALGLASAIRGLIVGVLTLGIGGILNYLAYDTAITVKHPIIFLFFIFVGGLAFAWLGTAVGMWSKSFEHQNGISSFFLLPLMYLGGIFFDLDSLDPFWTAASELNPVVYFITGLRFAVLGTAEISLKTASIITIFFCSLFYCLSIMALKKGTNYR